MALNSDLEAAIAATRFGLGARPGEIAAAKGDPRGFLKAQITTRGADQPAGDFPTVAESLAGYAEFQADKKAQRMELAAQPAMSAAATAAPPRVNRARYVDPREEFMARAQLGAITDAAFRERWALFWSNHFAVAANKGAMAALVGHFEREAIRPHVFGRFEDLLVASTRHPGMLTYLDQARSVGPNSPGGARRRTGLNENLAREILELHTLGVNAGYTQEDVTEFARALTGWSFYTAAEAAPAGGDIFVFRARQHEPGARNIFRRRYPAGGEGQARAILRDLAVDPHTARHLATKIARHFVADEPSPALVSRLEARWKETDGRLDKVAEALIDAPEAWEPTPAKFKTPYEFMVSGYRAIGAQPRRQGELQVLTTLGQKPFTPPSPKGWAEEAGAWSAPDAIIKRMAWSQAFAQQTAQRVQPVQVAQNALGARLSPRSATVIARAESRPEALAVLLMSPEFQRR